MSPYAEAARAYLDAGWFPIRLPLNAKEPPPPGYTGRTATKRVTAETVTRWSEGEAYNVAVVLPDTVIGIDVDDYGGKPAAVTLRAAEATHGPLPGSPRVTSRDDGVSGIRFYRVPSGSTFVREVGPGIDVIQFGHRYAVAWPSVHPEGRTYRWLNPDGTERPSVPIVGDLPELPATWLAALSSGGAEVVSAGGDALSVPDAKAWLETFAGGQSCRQVADARDTAVRSLASNRHDTMTGAVWQLVSLGVEGHRGVRGALRAVRDAFLAALAGERNAVKEYSSALLSAVRKYDGQTVEQPCGCADPAEVASLIVSPTRDPRVLRGDEALSDPGDIPSIWGPKNAPLWAAGQSILVAGPPSTGKSTLAQRLMLARIGLVGDVLGYPVADDGGNVLYIAADRPAQIRQGIRRMVPVGSPQLQRFYMWSGPIPVSPDSDAYVRWFADLAHAYDVTTLVIDSVKDMLPNPSDEVSASAYNLARQHAIAEAVQWLEIHHNRKGNSDNRNPKQLDDVYGSRLLTAGAGSVLVLIGHSGDTEVTLSQKKPLGDTHPNIRITIDGATGDLDVSQEGESPLMSALLVAGTDGLTPSEAARSVYGETISTQDADRIRKRLSRMAERGELTARPAGRAVRYFLLT